MKKILILCLGVICFATEVQLNNDFVIVSKGTKEYIVSKPKIYLIKEMNFGKEYYLINATGAFSNIEITEKQYIELKGKLK